MANYPFYPILSGALEKCQFVFAIKVDPDQTSRFMASDLILHGVPISYLWGLGNNG